MAGALQLKKDLKGMIRGIDYNMFAINPVTIALEKKSLVNVPETVTKDFEDILFQMQDELKSIKDQIAMMNSNKCKADQKKRVYDSYIKKFNCILENTDMSKYDEDTENCVIQFINNEEIKGNKVNL